MPTSSTTARKRIVEIIEIIFNDVNYQTFIETLAEDAIVVVPSRSLFIKGREPIAEYFKKHSDTLQNFKFECLQTEFVSETDDTFVVCMNARFLMNKTNDFLPFQCTVIFKLDETGYKTTFMHTSYPNTVLQNSLTKDFTTDADFAFYQSLLDQKTEVIEMVANTINGGLKGSNDDNVFSFFYVNDGLCNMLGYTLDEFMEMSGGSAVGACYPPDLDSALQSVAEWFAKGPEYKATYRMRKKDGSLIWVSDTGRKFLDKDGITRINSIILDITAERESLDALRIERERYRIALESMDSILFEYDVINDIFYINEVDDSKSDTMKMLTLTDFKDKLFKPGIMDSASVDSMWKICTGEHCGPIEIRANSFTKPETGIRDVSVRSKVIKGANGIIERVIGVFDDITEKKKQEEKLLHDASVDSLTGFYNYVTGKQKTQQILDETAQTSGALFIIDLDDFKQFNNRFGHVFGNAILINVADQLSRICLPSDILTRVGDDEFFVYLKGISRSDAVVKAGKISEAIQAIDTGSPESALSCSIGIAVACGDFSNFDELFTAADKALRWSKKNGIGGVELYQNEQKYTDSTMQTHERFIDVTSPTSSSFSPRQLVSFALDIFEKTANIQSALKILLGVLGRNLNIDRITVHQIGTPDVIWTDEKTSPFSCENWSVLLPKNDLYSLVEKQDTTGTVVVYSNALEGFSSSSHLLLTQNYSNTILYAIIFGAGQHLGAVSFANCNQFRNWTTLEREVLGEISRIIAARVAAIRAVATAEKKLDYVVNYDNITGLMSFGRFKEEMQKAFSSLTNTKYVVLYIDIQSFKYINEKLGYREGDNILKDFATFIQATSKRVVAMTRAMADHFVILLEAATFDEDFISSINDMHDAFRDEENHKYTSINLMFRTGIYIVADRNVDVSLCIDRANLARKAIKHTQGSDAVIYNSEIGREIAMENELLTHMQTGLDNDEFVVYMQPKVRLTDYKVIGAEALVRWQKQDGSLISPLNFVPLFEKNGFITKIDKHVLLKTVEQLCKWQQEGFAILPISVNASCLHANDHDYALYLFDLLRKHGVHPGMLEVELTESAIVDNLVSVQNMLSDIRGIGVKTSIDDLGAGYSVLNMIMNMPIDVVKIDREFFTGCIGSERGIQFLSQLINMIKGLGYTVLCEGVETIEQAKQLANIGCDLAQGYIFGRPMPINRFESLLHKRD